MGTDVRKFREGSGGFDEVGGRWGMFAPDAARLMNDAARLMNDAAGLMGAGWQVMMALSNDDEDQ
jgi:hypothetical protein